MLLSSQRTEKSDALLIYCNLKNILFLQRIEWLSNLVRGDDKPGDQPRLVDDYPLLIKSNENKSPRDILS